MSNKLRATLTLAEPAERLVDSDDNYIVTDNDEYIRAFELGSMKYNSTLTATAGLTAAMQGTAGLTAVLSVGGN